MKKERLELLITTIILALVIVLEELKIFSTINNFFLSQINLKNSLIIRITTDTASFEAFIAYMAILYFGFAIKRKSIPKNVISFIIAIIISMIATLFIKAFTMVPRPYEIQPHYSIITSIINADYFSFPSGHTVRVSVLAYYITYVFDSTKKSKLKYLSWIYALIIMYTRLALQVHYFSDLLAGIIVALWSSLLIINLENVWVKIYNKLFYKIKILNIK
ncbi:phosphatase PAP2 family protein [Caldisphaera sp.]|uniref:phosphatase PAP2 family protein n=1 Tax=Caldisphaera sp. TaxID=2060322 RepID=UPI003D0E7664